MNVRNRLVVSEALAPLTIAMVSLASLASFAPACKSEGQGGGGGAQSSGAPVTSSKKEGEPRAKPAHSASASATASAVALPPVKDCGSIGSEVDDKVFAPFLPRLAGSYCADGAAIKSYGADAKLDMDKLCTTAMDGGCVEYKDLGIRRFAQLQYKEGHGQGSWVEVRLSRFATPGGAFALFTKHVVAGDPAELGKGDGMKPFAAGGAGMVGGGTVNVWKGEYVLELVFGSDDPVVQGSKAAYKKAARDATEPMAADIAGKLPGTNDALPDVKLLPEADRYSLGVEYTLDEPFGAKGAGDAATGYYHTGDKRYRVVAMSRTDSEKARSALGLLKAKGGQAVSGLGDEAATVEFTTPDKKKLEGVFARSGTNVFGIVDDEYAIDKKLSPDEKKDKLKSLLGSAAPAPASSAPKK